VSDAARKAAYRDRRKGIEHPDDIIADIDQALAAV